MFIIVHNESSSYTFEAEISQDLYVKKHCIYIIKINWFMVFREIMTVRPENHTKTDKYIPLQDAKSFIVKASSTYSYH
jgi:hypothetical protein